MAAFFNREMDTTYSAGMSSALSTFYNKRLNVFDIVEQNYSEPMSFTLQIINKDASAFDPIKERAIKKWLCKKGTYHWFIIDKNGYENIYWNANISNPKVLFVGNVIGMEFECKLDSPFGYSKPIEKRFEITEGNKNIYLAINTDGEKYIYPYLEITAKEYGNLNIVNSTELIQSNFLLNNVVANEKITLDNKLPFIFSSQNGHNIYSDFNKRWIRLIDGQNILTFNINCSVFIKYREIREVGIFA